MDEPRGSSSIPSLRIHHGKHPVSRNLPTHVFSDQNRKPFEERLGSHGREIARVPEPASVDPAPSTFSILADLGYVQRIMTRDETTHPGGHPPVDPDLLPRLKELCHEGREIWSRFDVRVRGEAFHPFVAAEYEDVLTALISIREPGRRFLEWGSATGVIAIMADLLGFEAYGIELDAELVAEARRLADAWGSDARFAAGSLLPTGYRFRGNQGGENLGTIGEGPSGYLELGHPLEEFDVVYGFPWSGEEAMMLDLMKCYGRSDALLLLNTGDHGMTMYRGGRSMV